MCAMPITRSSKLSVSLSRPHQKTSRNSSVASLWIVAGNNDRGELYIIPFASAQKELEPSPQRRIIHPPRFHFKQKALYRRGRDAALEAPIPDFLAHLPGWLIFSSRDDPSAAAMSDPTTSTKSSSLAATPVLVESATASTPSPIVTSPSTSSSTASVTSTSASKTSQEEKSESESASSEASKKHRKSDAELKDVLSGLVQFLGSKAKVAIAKPNATHSGEGGIQHLPPEGAPDPDHVRVNDRGPTLAEDLEKQNRIGGDIEIPKSQLEQREGLRGTPKPPKDEEPVQFAQNTRRRPPQTQGTERPKPAENPVESRHPSPPRSSDEDRHGPPRSRPSGIVFFSDAPGPPAPVSSSQRPFLPPQRPPVRIPRPQVGGPSVSPPPFKSGVPIPEQIVPLPSRPADRMTPPPPPPRPGRPLSPGLRLSSKPRPPPGIGVELPDGTIINFMKPADEGIRPYPMQPGRKDNGGIPLPWEELSSALHSASKESSEKESSKEQNKFVEFDDEPDPDYGDPSATVKVPVVQPPTIAIDTVEPPPQLESSVTDTESSEEELISTPPPSPQVLFPSQARPEPSPQPRPSSKPYVPVLNGGLRPGLVFDASDSSEEQSNDVITGAGIGNRGPERDTFEVTVSAKQNYGGPQGIPEIKTVPIHDVRPGGQVEESVILTKPPAGTEDWVSIDGRKTYFEIFPTEPLHTIGAKSPEIARAPESTPATPNNLEIKPRPTLSQAGIGQGFIRPLPPEEADEILGLKKKRPTVPIEDSFSSLGETSAGISSTSRRPFTRRPAVPPVRIDTCIVGDDSTCKEEQFESCKTVFGVSSCYCRPGYGRRKHREPCKEVTSYLVSLKLDRLDSSPIVWSNQLEDSNTEMYQRLEWEAEHAVESLIRRTRYAPHFMKTSVNNFYLIGPKVIVNTTIHLLKDDSTVSTSIRTQLRKDLTDNIRTLRNRLGESELFVDGFINALPQLGDLNECLDKDMNDCHEFADCTNTFGSFTCECKRGYNDPFSEKSSRRGRYCESCSPAYCNNHGVCQIIEGSHICECDSSYFGSRCEMDGEVLGVAVGASIVAIIIIILTLVFLCVWSRRWRRQEQEKAAAMDFGTYPHPMANAPALAVLSARLNGKKTPNPTYQMPYRFTREDQSYGAYHDATLQVQYAGPSGKIPGNIYGPEPPMRSHTPSATTALYATANLAFHGLKNGSGSAGPYLLEGDDDDEPPRNHRPRSRASYANTGIHSSNGIYYDVDTAQSEIYARNPAAGMPHAYGGHHPLHSQRGGQFYP
ncbi:unnamed protein product [Cyprideis torosa]|uniref:Uncharacterized protein n=1 Tax=Cyprideis torosa TaxID=163714 RepID=A0A7R8W7J8_9CRUS|nr:unnamed protein product [Cyprideis torosa]CAG0882510.1 unnamed protein product [Cyprideis torosa]